MNNTRILALGLSLMFGWAVAIAPFDTGNAAGPPPPDKTTSGPPAHENITGPRAHKTTPGLTAQPPVYKTYSVRPPHTTLSASKAKPRFCPAGKKYVWVCEMICDLRGCRPFACHPEVQCW